jgi:VWFA-related protein
MARRLALCIILVCCALPAVAQQNAPAPVEGINIPAAPPIRPDRHIELDVTVSEKSGRLVPGLQQQDFSILDNKQAQKIVSFRQVTGTTAQEAPAQVILLVDTVNTSFQSVSYERSEIVKYLQQNGGKLALPTSLIFFSDLNTQLQTQPTRDSNALIAEFDKNQTALRTIRRSQGFYGAEDRIDLSLRTLGALTVYESSQPGRKFLIWISPGWPLLSGPRVELSRKQQDGLFRSIVAMSAALRQARITLYSVDPLGTADAGGVRTFYYEEFLKGVRKVNDVAPADLSLQVLAVQSGGRALNSSNDLTGEIESCIADANSYYILSFDAAPADQPNEYHNLEIKVDKPGLSVRSRTGYYAQP